MRHCGSIMSARLAAVRLRNGKNTRHRQVTPARSTSFMTLPKPGIFTKRSGYFSADSENRKYYSSKVLCWLNDPSLNLKYRVALRLSKEFPDCSNLHDSIAFVSSHFKLYLHQTAKRRVVYFIFATFLFYESKIICLSVFSVTYL